ncbi:MAG: transglutaminase domain-containing protein [Akkermansiaceae bacterium]|nr:transglutaminase domain-containing protein [Akkermansiaceae bacterium]
MRSGLLILAVIAGYILLRGWPEQWHPIIRIFVSASLLVIAFSFWGQCERSTSTLAKSARKPRAFDYLAISLAVLLIESFFLVFLSIVPEKSEEFAITLDDLLQSDSDYEKKKNSSESQEKNRGSNGENESLITSNWLFSGPGRRSLNKNKKVRPSNRPEVYLFPSTTNDARTLLDRELFLRNFTLATYRKESWFPLSMIPQTLSARNEVINFEVTEIEPKITYEISHQVNRGGPTLAITVPNLLSIKQPSLREISPDTFRLPPNTIRGEEYRYEVTSTPLDFDKILETIPGTLLSPEYLELPSNPKLRGKIKTLAARFGTPTRESLLSLRRYLHENCRYSLDPAMPAIAEPVESFLFETKTGYCTHFATATVLLARAMGFPARIAFGWSGGRYFSDPNLFVFRAREAHSWAEIYLKDRGWVIFETTPALREEGLPSVAPTDEISPYLTNFGDVDKKLNGTNTDPLLKVSLWIGVALFALFIGALIIKRPSVLISGDSPVPGFLPHSPNYLSAFRSACLAHGHPMPSGCTLRTHLEKITAPDFTVKLLQYHYSVLYGDQPRNKMIEKKLLHQLRKWEREAV